MIRIVVLLIAAAAGVASAVLALKTKGVVVERTEQLAQTNKDLAGTKKSLEEEKAKLQQATAAKEAADSKATSLEAKLATTEKSLADASTELTDTKGKLATTETESLAAKKELEDFKAQFPPDMPPDKVVASLKEKDSTIKVAQEEVDILKKKLAEKTDRPAAPAPGAAAAGGPTGRPSAPGIQGKIVAVNHQWNFVVVNVGGERGLAENAEMVVVRGDQAIAKLKIAKVDPQTAVADIVKSASKVRPTVGDVVITN
jgi:hypothetical protein